MGGYKGASGLGGSMRYGTRRTVKKIKVYFLRAIYKDQTDKNIYLKARVFARWWFETVQMMLIFSAIKYLYDITKSPWVNGLLFISFVSFNLYLGSYLLTTPWWVDPLYRSRSEWLRIAATVLVFSPFIMALNYFVYGVFPTLIGELVKLQGGGT